jgi:hypothetical protein
MVEFHGWAVLRWAGNATGSDAQMSAIRQALDSARSDFSTAGIVTPGNDLTIVCVHGLRNHRTPSIQHLFAVIAKRHPSRTACCTFVMLRTRGDSISRTAFGSGGSLAGNAPRWPTPSFHRAFQRSRRHTVRPRSSDSVLLVRGMSSSWSPHTGAVPSARLPSTPRLRGRDRATHGCVPSMGGKPCIPACV